MSRLSKRLRTRCRGWERAWDCVGIFCWYWGQTPSCVRQWNQSQARYWICWYARGLRCHQPSCKLLQVCNVSHQRERRTQLEPYWSLEFLQEWRASGQQSIVRVGCNPGIVSHLVMSSVWSESKERQSLLVFHLRQWWQRRLVVHRLHTFEEAFLQWS